jgi:hypothetical protein
MLDRSRAAGVAMLDGISFHYGRASQGLSSRRRHGYGQWRELITLWFRGNELVSEALVDLA